MNIFKYSILFLLVFFENSYALGIEKSSIELTINKGNAPLNVKVSGPATLIKHGFGKPKMFTGCGFSINWGDGSPLSSNCEEWLQHTYTTAGSYEVVATLWHPGPTDIPITTWEGRAKVEVVASTLTSSSLKSIRLSGTDFGFQQLPEIRLEFSAVKKIDIKIDLINSNNEIVTSQTDKGISFIGEKTYRLPAGGMGSLYNNQLLKGNTKFRFRASMLDEGKEISKLTSPSFISSPEIRHEHIIEDFTVNIKGKISPLEVEAKYKIYHPDCFNYEIDWGDNSKNVVETKITQTGCAGNFREVSLGAHKYLHPGQYLIKLKTNQFNLWANLKDIPEYIQKSVVLK